MEVGFPLGLGSFLCRTKSINVVESVSVIKQYQLCFPQYSYTAKFLCYIFVFFYPSNLKTWTNVQNMLFAQVQDSVFSLQSEDWFSNPWRGPLDLRATKIWVPHANMPRSQNLLKIILKTITCQLIHYFPTKLFGNSKMVLRWLIGSKFLTQSSTFSFLSMLENVW